MKKEDTGTQPINEVKHQWSMYENNSNRVWIQDKGGVICEVLGYDRIEEAHRIVTAVNSYDDMLEALTQLLDRLTFHGSIDPIREEGPIEDARQAIAKATNS